MFGLGERYGDFFLEPNTTYALYNNDNKLPTSYVSETRRMVYGRNGFYPALYSHVQHPSENLLTAMIIGDPQNEFSMEGKEITYSRPVEGLDRFTLESTRHRVQFKLVFGLNPVDTVEKVFEHTQLMKTEAPRLPPPSWAFGYHIPLSRSIIGIQELVGTIRGKDFNFPIEGFI